MSAARVVGSSLVLAVRNRNVRRAELAWGTAIAAEWAHFVALGVFAYRGGGASAVGLAGLVRLLPAAVMAPVAASMGDRVRRERFLLAVLLLATAAMVGSAVAAAAGTRAGVYACAAAVGVSATLIRPTLQAILPALARNPQELIAANAATSTIESAGMLVGPLVAGVLVGSAQIAVSFAVAAALLAVGAAVITGIRPERTARAAAPRPSPLSALRQARAATARIPAARLVLALMVAQTFVRGCLNVLIVVSVFRVLHSGAGAVGYLTAAIGVGGLIGALWALSLQHRRLAILFVVALACWGLPIALMASYSSLVAYLVLAVVIGVANSVEDVAGFTVVQRVLPDEVLNGVLAAFWGLAMGAVAVGSIAAPGIVTAVGPRPALLLVGVLLPVLALGSYRALAGLDKETEPSPALAVVARVGMFAPLSLATKERLAKRVVAVTVSPGQSIIRAGETGDRFYIVGSGDLDVAVDGRHKTLSTGECFGEIALLDDVPRTATVTAASTARLYALGRDDFLAAVTGHPEAERAARDTVAGHLAASSDSPEPS